MSVRIKKYILIVFWFTVIFSGPVSVLRNTSIDTVFSNPLILINFFQRITGLLAFSLIYLQILLGVFMNSIIQITGAKAYKIHVSQGLSAYLLIMTHPLLESVFVFQAAGSITGALSVFIPGLANQRDLYLAFGRTALVLATVSTVAAYFRTKPFFRRNWRAFHILNYLVFYLVFIHMRLGTDVSTAPFSWVSYLALFSVSSSIVYRIFRGGFDKLKLKAVKKDIQKA